MNRREIIAALAGAAAAPALAQPAPAGSSPAAADGWRLLPTEPFRGKQDDIWFVDMDHGWYGNGSGKLYRTADGGDSWQKVWDHPGTFIRSLGFIDRQRGFLGNVGVNYYPGVTDRTPLYRTEDGGATWTPVAAEGIDRVAGICGIDVLPVRRIFQGEMRTSHVIHAAGRVGGPTAILRSEDDGLTWTVHDLSALAGMVLDVKFLSPRTGFVAASSPGENGTGEAMILRTDDGCRTWRSVYRSGRRQENVWKMSWPSASIGYGTVQSYNEADQNRVFVRTNDGGRTWHEHPLAQGPRLQEFGVGFLTPERGWIGCMSHGFETHDGGRSWAPVEFGMAVNKIRIVRDGRRTRVFTIGVDVHRLDVG